MANRIPLASLAAGKLVAWPPANPRITEYREIMRMSHSRCIATLIVVSLAALAVGGCRATPIGATVGVASFAVDEVDVRERSEELLGAPTETADVILGLPTDVFRSERPHREWRAYPVKHDVLGKYRYLLEVSDTYPRHHA